MSFYIVCYDISDDRRRLKVAKILEGYGERRQYSLFECHLTDAQLKRLWQRLDEVINSEQDSVLCYTLCQSCLKKVTAMGVSTPTLAEPAYYVV